MTKPRPDIIIAPAFQGTSSPRFQDAMLVRTEVFVEEQKVPAENELDSDDKTSWHFVAYTSSSSSNIPIPIATARIVLPPYDPHPREGPALHPPSGYLKIGRLATRKAWRGKGVAGLLVEEVVRFASENLGRVVEEWDGRLLAHAQIAVREAWGRMGFLSGSRVEGGEERGYMTSAGDGYFAKSQS
ncbi:hypothetical protein EX30DRAFT_360683 [Ascodesmis nigricans]|uniref:N-acetyltransferase domain-containing protein n=1 Tax=Ascodesmis nigricans TaxID=341454 RepID=A0A4S2N5Z1_9PEZI|nr:hypothetical protein EX30DRAFT_360683 [Ascodesmis nigricans]